MFDDIVEAARGILSLGTEHVPAVKWRPAADVYRTPSGWLLKIELAGVQQEHIEVTLSGRILSIQGKRLDSSKPCEAGKCHSLEIAYSHFERRFEVPNDPGRVHVVTDYKDGMFFVQIISEEPGQ